MAEAAPSQSIRCVSPPRPPPGWRASASCQPMRPIVTAELLQRRGKRREAIGAQNGEGSHSGTD